MVVYIGSSITAKAYDHFAISLESYFCMVLSMENKIKPQQIYTHNLAFTTQSLPDFIYVPSSNAVKYLCFTDKRFKWNQHIRSKRFNSKLVFSYA